MNPSPLRRAQALAAVSALSEIFKLARPADAVLDGLFRDNRQMGSKDRRHVSDLVYGVLRDLRGLQGRVGDALDAAALCSAYLVVHRQTPADALAALGLPPLQPAAGAADLPPAVRLNLPDWLYASLARQHGADALEPLAQALRQPATVDLRVNKERATRDMALASLRADGIAAEPTPLSPIGIRLAKRAPLQALDVSRQGWVEPQDEGSQLLALLLNPQPGETVVDFCAGAGGKTLALAASMRNQGVVHAFDVSSARLHKLVPRAERAGVGIVQTRVLREERDPALNELAARADAVLVDVPCSGSGTLRRHPELRLRPVDLPQLHAQQLAILSAAAALVRPGGRLVYATCSLAAEENEDLVREFLATAPDFAQADAGGVLRAQGAAYEGAQLKLLPHRHGTDGFFAALFLRGTVAPGA